jgi:hypothetical protein
MAFTRALFALALLGLHNIVEAAKPEPQEPVDRWTVTNVTRTRSSDNTLCGWQFYVHQASDGNKQPSACRFNVTSPEGQDCGVASFSNLPCGWNDTFAANGGHNANGFYVMVLVNLEAGTQGYMGYSDQALNASTKTPVAKQIVAAYPQPGTH